MSKTICPGQDTRYWRPGDIFEIKCGNCGNTIEFFKDEASRRCACGNRVENPKLSMGCAQWCEHAKECLGYDPKEEAADANNAENSNSLSDKLIKAVRFEFGEDSNVYRDAKLALERAENLLNKEEANPRVVIAGAILLGVDFTSSENINGSPAALNRDNGLLLPAATKIMKDAEMKNITIDEVCDIIENYHKGRDIDTQEFRIVSESYNAIKSR